MTPYPLSWPETLPRTKVRAKSAFKTTVHQALENVATSLRLFGRDTALSVNEVIQSSNVSLGIKTPDDPGVAV